MGLEKTSFVLGDLCLHVLTVFKLLIPQVKLFVPACTVRQFGSELISSSILSKIDVACIIRKYSLTTCQVPVPAVLTDKQILIEERIDNYVITNLPNETIEMILFHAVKYSKNSTETCVVTGLLKI